MTPQPLLNPGLSGGRGIDECLAPDRECDDHDCIFDLPVHRVADVRDFTRVRCGIRNLARPEAAKRGVSRAARSLSRTGMPLAISLIVDGYVRLGDREALETLRAHRVEMLESARSIAEMDTSRMIATLKEEIEIVDAGLSRLNDLREEQELAPAPLRQPSP
jgi:hypothetical protein